MACRIRPQSGWPPTSARVRPPDTRLDTVSTEQSPLRTPGSRWPGDGHGGPLHRPVGRTPPVRGDRPADGSGPGPDSGGKRRTPPAPSVRPCLWPAGHGQPRGLYVLAMTGPGRTALRMLAFGQSQPLPASGPPMVTICADAGCRHVQSLSRPMSARSCPTSTMDATIGQPSGHRMSGRSGRTPSTPPGTPCRTGSDTDRGTSDILDCHDHEDGPPGRAEPLLWGRRLRLGNKVGSAMARLPTRPYPTVATRRSCSMSLHRPRRASAHCSPRIDSG
jgi:hypothetical protein